MWGMLWHLAGVYGFYEVGKTSVGRKLTFNGRAWKIELNAWFLKSIAPWLKKETFPWLLGSMTICKVLIILNGFLNDNFLN